MDSAELDASIPAGVPDSQPENSRPCGNCQHEGCPFCKCSCLDGQCKICFAAYRAQMARKASETASSSDSVMGKLEEMMRTLATKEDVREMKIELRNDILKETKLSIGQAVEPL